MAIGTDFEIQNDKDIRYIGAAHAASGAGYYTVLELHRWLQGLADDASISNDDYLDITRDTPSERATDNIVTLINVYNVDDTTAEHLYNGSVVQTVSGSLEYYDGLVVIAAEGMDLQIIQDGAVIVNDFWNTIPFGGTKKGLNRDVANGISHRFMLKVREGTGGDIDGRRILCQTRVWGYTYSEFKINGTARGNNVAALTYAADLNNASDITDAAGWTEVTLATQGYNGIDVDNDLADEYYYSEWNVGGRTINEFYERMKWLSRQGSASTLYGLNGELFRGITHEVPVHNQGATDFSAYEEVTWSTGSGQLLAVDNVNAATKLWIQLITGTAPTDTLVITGTTSAAYADVNGSAIERSLSFPFCGQSTGTSIIGAYGFGIEAIDLSDLDKVFALDTFMYQAPNYVSFTVDGLVAGEDYVLVAPNDGGAIDLNQLTLFAELDQAGTTSVVVNEAIPANTPSDGTIRILRTSGKYTRHPYSTRAGSTFTITSHDFSSDHAIEDANVFISYIDDLADTAGELTFTSIYSGTLSLFIRVRDGGTTPIKTFQSTANFADADMTVTASRITDA